MISKLSSLGPTYSVRLILKEGEQLSIGSADIKTAKVKFTPVGEKPAFSNRISSGDYVIGRDVKAGKYRLSSPQLNNKKFDKVEWRVWVYNNRDQKQRQVKIDAKNEPEIELHQGEVISSSYSGFQDRGTKKQEKLVLTPIH